MPVQQESDASEPEPNDRSAPSLIEAAARQPNPQASPHKSAFLTLAIGSVGVVYGDIGTSPLYALKESLTAASSGAPPTPTSILGVVSLILWTLIVIVTIKYVLFLLRVDNQGQGGTLTLVALVRRALPAGSGVLILGIVGAALFYGDAIITPAISVLSAVEGLKVVTPAFEPFVLPLSIGIIVALFAVQAHGTARVAAFFGPITAIWFAAMAAGAIPHILAAPGIFAAINPLHGVDFLMQSGLVGFLTLGAVFLAVTGAEALYADLGHFGRRPIQAAWLGLVFPALAINYLGQGALLLAAPDKLSNPFFLLYPSWAVLPMVLLATVATIIASQAVITGAYSLTQQAMQMGLLPRFEVRQTSAAHVGQIYLPRVNWWMLVLVVLTIGIFKSSSALASAYGIAVTGTMLVTTMLVFVLVHRGWGWPLWLTGLLIAPLAAIETLFLSANLIKVIDGGWLPLVVGGFLVLVMLTWIKGTSLLRQQALRTDVPLAKLLPSVERRPAEQRAPGAAVFLTAEPETTPTSLLHNLKHNRVLHERNIILTVETRTVPEVAHAERFTIRRLSATFEQAMLRFGYMERPDVARELLALRQKSLGLDAMGTSFFLSRRVLRMSGGGAMPAWQAQLFAALYRMSDDAARYFRLPADRVVEIGTQTNV